MKVSQWAQNYNLRNMSPLSLLAGAIPWHLPLASLLRQIDIVAVNHLGKVIEALTIKWWS